MIKSYSFKIMDERMYLISETNNDTAVVIDPFVCDEAFLELGNKKKLVIFLTHHHFDHISGVNALREKFDCEVICTALCGETICSDSNGSRHFPFLFLQDKDTFHYVRDNFEFPYYCKADTTFEGSMEYSAAGHDFTLIEMPGHTRTCMMILMDDKFIFSGDNVLGNGYELETIGAVKEEYINNVIPFLEKYENSNVTIMPGHGDPGMVLHFLKLIREYIWN